MIAGILGTHFRGGNPFLSWSRKRRDERKVTTLSTTQAIQQSTGLMSRAANEHAANGHHGRNFRRGAAEAVEVDGHAREGRTRADDESSVQQHEEVDERVVGRLVGVRRERRVRISRRYSEVHKPGHRVPELGLG